MLHLGNRKSLAFSFWKYNRNDIRENLITHFFLKYTFPVVISVDGKVIIFTPLLDSKTTCFLINKALSPFIKMELMKFLIGFHENTSLIH